MIKIKVLHSGGRRGEILWEFLRGEADFSEVTSLEEADLVLVAGVAQIPTEGLTPDNYRKMVVFYTEGEDVGGFAGAALARDHYNLLGCEAYPKDKDDLIGALILYESELENPPVF